NEDAAPLGEGFTIAAREQVELVELVASFQGLDQAMRRSKCTTGSQTALVRVHVVRQGTPYARSGLGQEARPLPYKQILCVVVHRVQMATGAAHASPRRAASSSLWKRCAWTRQRKAWRCSPCCSCRSATSSHLSQTSA